MERRVSTCKALCPLIGVIGVIIVVACAFAYPGTLHFFVKLVQEIHSLGLAGLFVFILSYPVALAVGFPVSLLDMVVGFLYPWVVGLLAVWVGKTVGCAGCYCIAKWVFADNFQYWAHEVPILRALTHLLRLRPWKYCFLFRAIYMPTTLKNYGLAALHTPFIPYFLSSVVLDFVFSLWMVTVGREGKTMINSSQVKIGEKELVWMVVAATVSVIATGLLIFYTRRVLRNIQLLSAGFHSEDSDSEEAR